MLQAEHLQHEGMAMQSLQAQLQCVHFPVFGDAASGKLLHLSHQHGPQWT